MMRHFAISFAVLLGSAILAGSAMALTADEIMVRVDARDDGDNITSTIEMVLIDKNGNQRKRVMRSFARDQGRDTQRLLFFESPQDVRNTGFLTYDFYAPNRNDDQWLYLPELRKTKRIAAADKSSSFMGSDFSYADMTRRIPSEWKYRLIGEETVRGKKVWVIEALPANSGIRKRYGYEKSVVFVRQDIFMVVRAVHWTRDGRLKYLDVKQVDRISGVWAATNFEMRTTKRKAILHRTTMRLRNIKFNQNLGSGLFSLRRLEKGL